MLGFGTFLMGGSECEESVLAAIRSGYRMIDTAEAYRNEEAVGSAIVKSGIPREELFLVTKVNFRSYENTRETVEASLNKLKTSYLDLVLLHWPFGNYYAAWRELEKMYHEGKIRAIGVSNFGPDRYLDIQHFAEVKPAVNQIECHPLWNRKPLIAFCRSHGIAVQAYAPLARGLYLNREIMQQLAEKYVRTEAQIGLRYLIQQGISVIPKSTQPDRIFANADVFDFELSEADMALIDTMDEQLRSASIPDDLL